MKKITKLEDYKCDGKTSARQDFINIQSSLTNMKERDKHSYRICKIKVRQAYTVKDR